ncbi:MAG: ATP-binding protein [Myxococcota bacterium]
MRLWHSHGYERTARVVTVAPRAGRGAVLLVLLWWVAGVASAQESAASSSADPGPLLQQELLESLRALNRGALPAETGVASLFAVPLDQPRAIEGRLAGLRDELASLDAQLRAASEVLAGLEVPSDDVPEPSAPPVDPDSELAGEDDPGAAAALPDPGRKPERERARAEREERREVLHGEQVSLRLQRDIAAARVAYLEPLLARLDDMPEAALRILPGIAESRPMLREQSLAQRELAGALDETAGRLDDLQLRLRSGALVGFVTEARRVAGVFGASAEGLRDRAARLRQVADAQERLASRLETEARELRRTVFVTLRAEDHAERIDTLFLRHIEAQRQLQRGVSRSELGVDPERLDRTNARAQALLPDPRRVGTVAAAAGLAEPVAELLAELDAELLASARAEAGWRLAFENEVVTVLSGLSSPAVHREAYALSSTVLRDVRAEAGLAWGRMSRDWEDLRDEVPSVTALFASERGRAALMRLLGLLGVFAAWWFARRSTGAIVVAGVRATARAARNRVGIRYGTIVRWSGLFESVLPVVFAYVAFRLALAILGPDSLPAAVLRTVGTPLLWYWLGLRVLLGLTQRITPGRPALIEVRKVTRDRLEVTYARLGWFIAIAAVLDGIARLVIGEGMIVTLVDGIALLWVGVWAAWEAFSWRVPLAEAWAARGTTDAETPPSFEVRVAGWMQRSRWGCLLSPVALVRVFLARLADGLRELSRRTDLAELLAARRLRRAAKNEDVGKNAGDPEVPDEYLKEFPLRPILGEDDAVLLPREEVVSEILGQLATWRESRSEGSVAIVGEKGSGKTTLAALVARRVDDELVVVQHTLRGKPMGADELFRALSPNLPVNGASDLEEWIDGLCAGPERVVLLDEAHNAFLRTVGGYETYDALVELVNATSSKIFWILLFNSFTWRFLNESHSRLHYFRRLLEVPKWSADDIRELIRRRNRQTGFEVEFDDLLLDGERESRGRLELVEGADGFFRLLRESSGGNPRIATRLWLSSLSVVGDKKLRVSAFREPHSDALDGMSDELLFALAAVTQHENLSTQELRRVLNVSDSLARFAVRFLREAGLVVPKDGSVDRVTLAANYYRQTLRALRKKHLLFE